MDDEIKLNKEEQLDKKQDKPQDDVTNRAAESHHCSKAAQAVFNTVSYPAMSKRQFRSLTLTA